jgi:hypothetical protein
MKSLAMTAAILNGMNHHNRLIAESRKVGEVKLTDYCGNVFTLYVWAKADGGLHYLLSCNRMPQAIDNIFRGPLPTKPLATDAATLAAIAAVRNVAKTVTASR